MIRANIQNIMAISLLCFGTSFAQSIPVVKQIPKFDLGIKIGANFAQIADDGWQKTHKPGIDCGLFLGVRKNKIGAP